MPPLGDAKGLHMANTTHCRIRALAAGDVPALLDIIRTVRFEYGIENRCEAVLNSTDLGLFDQYRRRRTTYFVALEGHV